MRGAARALLAALTVVGLIVVLPGGSAQAATTVSISDVESSGTSLTGVLTFRAPEIVEVDPDSLTATVDGTERPAQVSASSSIERTSMLVIDTSGSMGATGMETVRSATKAYLTEAPKDVRIGVTTFADTAGVDLAPTTNRAKVRRVVDGLRARGETSLYAAVSAAAKQLGTEGDRSMVLLSDGADTMSEDPEAGLAAATRAVRKKGIRVDVVRFRTEDKDTMNALDGFATAGGGSVIAADDAEAVGDAFQTAARALNSQATFTITTPQALTGSHTIRLAGTAGGTPFAVEQRVDVGGATAASPAAAPPVEPEVSSLAVGGGAGLTSSPWPWIGALALGGALFLFSFGLLVPTVQTRRERRLAAMDDYVMPELRMSRREDKAEATGLSERLVDLGERAMQRRRSTARTMQLINRADLPLRAGEWFVLCGVAVVVTVAMGVVLLPGPAILGIVVGVVVGLVLPQMVLRFLAARRAKAFESVLPQSLILVATSLRSGFGLLQSLDAVAQDSAPPVDKEFSRALAETRIGTDIADALERLAERMGSESMRMTVMAIRIQRDVGGNLAETLDTTAHTLREREALVRQVASLSAEGRLSAQILIGLPIVMAIYMTFVNYDYVQLLWTTAIGIMMSIGAIVLMLVGIFWMRRVVKIEV